MRTYTVFWHYLGNHGAYERWASSPEDACRSVIRGFSDDFAAKAELIAVEGAFRMRPAKAYSSDAKTLAVKDDRFVYYDGSHGTVLSRQVNEHDKMLVGLLDGDDSAEFPLGRAFVTSKIKNYIPKPTE